MRRLILLSLVALAAFPLSARSRWYRPRRVVMVEGCPDVYRRWDGDRWEDRGRVYVRGYDRGCDRDEDRDCDEDRRYACEDRVVVRPLPRPLAPPFQARVELWFR